MSSIDLEKIAEYFDLKMEPKRNEDPADAKLRRFKDRWLFIATLIAFALVYATCIIYLASKPNSSFTGIILNGIFGLTLALAGYYVRGKTH